MLVWESQGFDLQELWLAQEAVDVNAQDMCGQFGVEPGTRAPEGMSVIDFDLEDLGKLTVVSGKPWLVFFFDRRSCLVAFSGSPANVVKRILPNHLLRLIIIKIPIGGATCWLHYCSLIQLRFVSVLLPFVAKMPSSKSTPFNLVLPVQTAIKSPRECIAAMSAQ